MKKGQNTGDKPDKDVRAAIFGSMTDNPSDLFPWTGNHKPNRLWLAEPLKNKSRDKVAKQICTGCGMAGEVSLTHLKRVFEIFDSSLDLPAIDWSKHYLEVNACDFCIETAPKDLMIIFALGLLPK